MSNSHKLSDEEQRKVDKKIGVVGFWILLIVTFLEVGVALFTREILPDSVVRLLMIAMSFFKAYYIISVFMHLGHEVGGMALSIVMPTTLLIWACIAFLWEGDYARNNRNYVKDPRPGAEVKTTTQTSIKSDNDISKMLTFE